MSLTSCFRIGHLLTLHVFPGMLLLGLVTLKAGSVLYRFVRHRSGSEPYRRKGPPALLLQFFGPVWEFPSPTKASQFRVSERSATVRPTL